MAPTATRRECLLGALGVLVSACAPARSPVATGEPRALEDVEARLHGRIGVYALDTGTGRALAHRADERFPMCSTFKWALVAAILDRADRGALRLDERLSYGEADLLEYAPATRAHVAEGAMTIEALAKVAITVSDNTAANLLLSRIGGPAGLTAFVRACGDTVTRLDRDEPSLNECAPGDVRDTTTPRAMVGLLRRVLLGDVLTTASRERLLGWLRACETGGDRLRAGLPREWGFGHKTGTGAPGTANDVGIAVPPGRAPILVASYMTEGPPAGDVLAAAQAEVGRIGSSGFRVGADWTASGAASPLQLVAGLSWSLPQWNRIAVRKLVKLR
jgi:beta-lactamase class A